MMCSCLRVFACFPVIVDCALFIVGRLLLFVGSFCSWLLVVVQCLSFVVYCCCVLSLFVALRCVRC